MRGLVLALALIPLPALAEFFTLKGHGGPIMGIATAPDGRIATASFDNSVGLWADRIPEWLEGHEAAVNAVVFNGTAIYSAGDDFTLRKWPGGDVVGRHQGKIVGLAASKTHVATASWDGTIGLWPVNGAAPTTLGSTGSGVNAVVFSSDGTQLYSAGMDGSLRIWDISNGQEINRLVEHGFGINELVLNEQDDWIAYGAVDGVTRILDLSTGEERDFTLDRRPILAMALSPDRRFLAVGDGEGYIMIIDTSDWRIAQTFAQRCGGQSGPWPFRSMVKTSMQAESMRPCTVGQSPPCPTGNRWLLPNRVFCKTPTRWTMVSVSLRGNARSVTA